MHKLLDIIFIFNGLYISALPSLASGQTRPSTTPTTRGSTTLRTVPPSSSVLTPAVNNCPHGQFQCGSSQCIPAILHCDGVPDCADQTDEAVDCSKYSS
jgi:hypothetical protein